MGTTRRAPEIRKIGDVRRGWGQAVQGEHGYEWPNGCGVCSFQFDDSLCDQLRSAIAWHERSSYAIAAAAGITRAAMDRFMQGDDDAISLRKAAAVARLVGHRLADQAIIDGLWNVYEKSGQRTFSVPRMNSLERRAWRRVASRA